MLLIIKKINLKITSSVTPSASIKSPEMSIFVFSDSEILFS